LYCEFTQFMPRTNHFPLHPRSASREAEEGTKEEQGGKDPAS